MCGILGIVNLDSEPVRLQELEMMNQFIAHRGPDGEGFFCHVNVGFGHRRLAIIDPRAGVQPFYSDDKSVVITYNGEVYNYVEMRRELEKDFAFHTQSDTEVILKAYQKWGIACLDRFRGMFAFAIYDKNKNKVFIVRDRVGIKPLYYYQSAGRLVFASEIMPILKADCVARQIEENNISEFFRYQYIHAPKTIYRNLYKLEQGYYLEIDTQSGNVRKERYWHLIVDNQRKSETEWLEELNDVLDDTVRMCVRSDVPFGAFLSGGVDSSLVVAIMSKYLDQPVQTFSIGFNEDQYSELPYAAQASQIIGTNHYPKIVTPVLAEDILAKMVVHFGEPFGDSSAIPTYYVSQASRNQVKMVLSGDGGDELFAGYNSYLQLYRLLQGKKWKLHYADKVRALLRMPQIGLYNRIKSNFRDQYNAAMQAFNDHELSLLFNPGVCIQPSQDEFEFENLSEAIDPIAYFQAQDYKTYMVDDVLTKVDRMSMANSLEVRVPLLDHKVVELAFRMPLDLRLRLQQSGFRKGIITKYILKKSATRFYPESFIYRPKQGFGIPVEEWCLGTLKSVITDKLGDRKNPIYEWVNFYYVSKMLGDYYLGIGGSAVQLWYLLMFSLWMEHVHNAK
jgi:asparagine synthase (glutamine-hydrolysing)